MLKKMIIFLTTLGMLVGLIWTPLRQKVKTTDGDNMPIAKVALVPMDDRPVNTYFPVIAAKAGGLSVIMPRENKLGGLVSPGDSEVIGKWLEEQAGQVDASVVSASMLAYGGLVASRTSVQTYDKAVQNIGAIIKLKQKSPDKPVYVFDTIQRLAITATTPATLKYYSQIREWAILYDEVHNLGMTNKKEALDHLQALIPPEVLSDYVGARTRNHKINMLLIDWVKRGYIDFLALAQDDAAAHGLHRAEQTELLAKANELGVSDRVKVFTGADEVGIALVSRVALQKMNFHPSVTVVYSGVHGDQWIPLYEDTKLAANVASHISAIGASESANVDKADIVLMINTPSIDNDPHVRKAELDRFVAEMQSLISRGKKVAVTDVVRPNKADPELISRLQKTGDIPQLMAFTAWGTAGNNIGSALGQALCRTAFLETYSIRHLPLMRSAAEAHVSLLLSSFANDCDYRNQVQAEAVSYMHALGGQNEYNLGLLYPQVNAFVEASMTAHVNDWYNNEFVGHSIPAGKHLQKKYNATIKELQGTTVVLPWPRLFEVKVDPRITVEIY